MTFLVALRNSSKKKTLFFTLMQTWFKKKSWNVANYLDRDLNIWDRIMISLVSTLTLFYSIKCNNRAFSIYNHTCILSFTRNISIFCDYLASKFTSALRTTSGGLAIDRSTAKKIKNILGIQRKWKVRIPKRKFLLGELSFIASVRNEI